MLCYRCCGVRRNLKALALQFLTNICSGQPSYSVFLENCVEASGRETLHFRRRRSEREQCPDPCFIDGWTERQYCWKVSDQRVPNLIS